MSDHLDRIDAIRRRAREVLTSDEAVYQWLDLPAPALNGKRPIDMLDSDLGAKEVESLLAGIAFGNAM